MQLFMLITYLQSLSPVLLYLLKINYNSRIKKKKKIIREKRGKIEQKKKTKICS